MARNDLDPFVVGQAHKLVVQWIQVIRGQGEQDLVGFLSDRAQVNRRAVEEWSLAQVVPPRSTSESILGYLVGTGREAGLVGRRSLIGRRQAEACRGHPEFDRVAEVSGSRLEVQGGLPHRS